MENAAIYCRLSKEDQDKITEGDDSASIQNQKMMLVDYALNRGFCVYDIYSDDDFKGFDQQRPDFNRLLTDAKLKKFNIIICKTQSRFTRDMELVEKYIHGMFPLLGIRFIGVVDNVDTDVKGNKKARQINGLVNEWYSEDLSENIRGVFHTKMIKGQFLGPFACYGYQKDDKDKYHLMIDEPAAAVVRKIFAYSVQGLGNKQICLKLQEEGIPTPSEYKAAQGLNYKHPKQDSFGKLGLWGPNTVRRILTNPMYIGHMVQGREKKLSYKSSKVVEVPREEWIIVPDCHEPIIEEEVFYLVQDLIKNRRYARTKNEDGSKRSAPLAGILRCLDCGNRLTRINGNMQYVYYYCSLYKRSGGTLCYPHSVRESKLEELLSGKIKELINQHLESNQLEELLTDQKETDRLKAKKRLQLQRLIDNQARLTKALTMLYVDKSNEQLSEKDYRTLKASLDQEKLELDQQALALSQEIDSLDLDNTNQERKEDLVKKYSNFESLSHEIINEFIEYIEVGEKDKEGNQEITLHYRF